MATLVFSLTQADQLMKKLKASAKGETMSLSTIQPSDLPSSTIHTVQYVGSISTHSAAHSSDLLDSLLGKLHTRRRRKLGRKGIVLSQGQQQLQETTGGPGKDCYSWGIVGCPYLAGNCGVSLFSSLW